MNPIDLNGKRSGTEAIEESLANDSGILLPTDLQPKPPYIPSQKRISSQKDYLKPLIAGLFIVILLLLLAFSSVPRRKTSQSLENKAATKPTGNSAAQGSAIPLLEASAAAEQKDGKNIQPEEIARTAKPSPAVERAQPSSIGEIAPFQGTASWEPPHITN